MLPIRLSWIGCACAVLARASGRYEGECVCGCDMVGVFVWC